MTGSKTTPGQGEHTVSEAGELTIGSYRDEDATFVIQLFGEFDLAGTSLFRKTITGAQRESKSIVLDLSGLDYVDSTALAELVYADQRARKNGHDLSVLRGGGAVERIIKIAGLDEVLPFAD